MDAADDLEQTMGGIARLTALAGTPGEDALAHAAVMLTGFVARHRGELSFENFPLPEDAADVLCSYELHRNEETGVTLYLNAMRGGVSSVIHDHGTWAILAGIRGTERHCIYKPIVEADSAGYASPSRERELAIGEGQSLALPAGLFHSIHTLPEVPTLLLHLYGCPHDRAHGRRIVDGRTGKLVYLADQKTV